MAIHSNSHSEAGSEGLSILRSRKHSQSGDSPDVVFVSALAEEDPPSPVKVLQTHSPFTHRVESQLYLAESCRPIPSGTPAEMETTDGRWVRGSIQISEAHEPYGPGLNLIPTLMQDSGKPELISRGCSLQLVGEDGGDQGSTIRSSSSNSSNSNNSNNNGNNTPPAAPQQAFLRPSAPNGRPYQPPHAAALHHPMGPVEYLLSTSGSASTSRSGSFSSSCSRPHTPPSTCTPSTSPSSSPFPPEMETMEVPVASPDTYPKHNMGPPPPPEWAADFHRSYIGTITRRDRAGTGLCEHKQTQRIRFRNAIAAYQCGFCSLRWTVKAHKIKSIDYTRVTPNHAAHYSKVVEARTHHPTSGRCAGNF